MIRLSYQKQRVDKATGFYIDPTQWVTKKQRLKGSLPPNNNINKWLHDIPSRIAGVTRGTEKDLALYLPSILKQLFATALEEPSLLKLIEGHNAELKERVGNGYTFSTYEKYVFTSIKVKSFIIGSLKMRDILLRDVTVKFIMDFDYYLRVVEGNQHNTAVKYCINLKRVLNVALLQGVIYSNPLNAFKTVYKDTPEI